VYDLQVFLYLEKSEELEGQGGSIGNKILKRRIEGWESRSLRQRRISTNSLNSTFTALTENNGKYSRFLLIFCYNSKLSIYSITDECIEF
jgi:hypothetical protein